MNFFVFVGGFLYSLAQDTEMSVCVFAYLDWLVGGGGGRRTFENISHEGEI
jgi:hypothetical protein